ncbi:hypothetical protein NLG97_g2572 [Lecanicillium saksenae]|uniref:Uncharacterized protein n=1 Tax=Lecanicillium saksenae TaxID=468837 RepID=A0ACC1R4K1_9HYPO|nr:hypothetical protein NLG97_g2572 [Lecanicillium saksenae]
MSNLSVWDPIAVGHCQQLAVALPGRVATPGTPPYDAFSKHFWSLQESTISPPCVLEPRSSSDVSSMIDALTKTGHECPFAVKGGGHSPYGGYANIHNGVVISMAGLNTMEISDDHSVVKIGSGLTWLPVYEFLDQIGGLAVAGGENGDVGVGGLLVGGGISILGPRVGWSCDNVVNFEVVLSSGQIINANQTHHSDLWKSLKGGTNNFGVVTRYDLATVPQKGGIWAGSLEFSTRSYSDIFRAFVQIADSSEYDPYAFFSLELRFQNTSWSVETVLSYSREVDTVSPPIFQPFLDLDSRANFSSKNTNFTTVANRGSQSPSNQIALSTGTYKINMDLLDFIFSSTDAMVRELSELHNNKLFWQVTFQPLPAAWNNQTRAKGGNSLGTDRIEGNSFVMLVTAMWPDNSLSAVTQSALETMQQIIDYYANSRHLKRDLVYLNYAGEAQSPLLSYGKENVKVLAQTAKKYDPDGVFQRLVPGGFKLSKGRHNLENII